MSNIDSTANKAKVEIQPKFKYRTIIILALGMLYMLFMSGLGTDQINILYEHLGQTRGWSNTQLVLPSTISGILLVPATWLSGTILMKSKPINMMAVGWLILGGCSLIMSTVDNYVVYFVAYVILGASASSIVAMSFQAIVAKWFISRRGWVLGVVTIGNPMSAVVFIPILNWALGKYGLAPTYTVVFFLMVVLAVISRLTITSDPKDKGLLPDGIVRSDDELAIMDKAEKNAGTLTPKQIYSMKETWMIILGCGLTGFAMIGGLMNLVPTLMGIGFTQTFSVYMMSIGSMIGMVLSYIWGHLDDKIGTPRTLAVMAIGYTVCCFGLAIGSMFPGHLWLGWLGGVGMGCLTGGMPNLNPSVLCFVYGRNEFLNVSRYISSIGYAMGAMGPTVMAFISERTGNYAISYSICIAFGVIAVICFLNIKKSYDPERQNLSGVKNY